MKIYVMTDMEGVCGSINHDDWMAPGGRYYEQGKELLTEEVNAAVRGFFDAGATEIVVADGHGSGGITPMLLDERAFLMRGWPARWPLLLDDTYDVIAFVGQHAKAGTPYAHLAHTQSFSMLDFRINGVSVGEFGQFACCAAFMGLPVIFGSGDLAFTQEAQQLAPGIETVAVKRGTTPRTSEDATAEEYGYKNLSAIHMHPKRARELIYRGAHKAMARFVEDPESFPLIPLKAPFRTDSYIRASKDKPAYHTYAEHPDDLLACMNTREKRVQE